MRDGFASLARLGFVGRNPPLEGDSQCDPRTHSEGSTKALTDEKSSVLPNPDDWTAAHAQGYSDGETWRLSGKPPSQYALVGIDDYCVGFRAGYFEHHNSGSTRFQTSYWGYSSKGGWEVREPTFNSAVCPDCHGQAYRISRRLIDRLKSLIVPQRRYQCKSRDCGWKGNLTIKQVARTSGSPELPVQLKRATDSQPAVPEAGHPDVTG